MASNDQNTIAGTKDGEKLIATNGSPFLDYLSGLTNVAKQGVDIYTNYYQQKQAVEIIKKQQTTPPAQTVPNNLVNSAAGFFSDPARTQQFFIYLSMGALLLAGGIWIIKKI